MKDLKHLYYFEKLLEEVNHELIREAQKEGQLAVGSVCFQIPEPLLNLPGCFSVRLRVRAFRRNRRDRCRGFFPKPRPDDPAGAAGVKTPHFYFISRADLTS